MTRYNIRFLDEASKDLDSIFEYILTDSPKNANNMLDNIMESVKMLEVFPFANSILNHKSLIRYNFRALVINPYIVFYRVIGEDVFIYRVLHGAMDYVKILKDGK